MNEDVIKKTNSAIKIRMTFKISQQIVALVMGILLARILSPSEFGVVAISNMIIYYANSFTNFGLNNALVQKEDVENRHINTVFTIDLTISTILMLLTFIFSDAIAIYFHNPDVSYVLKWMSLYYIITTFYHIPVVILRRDIDYYFLTIVEFVEAVLISLVAIAFALNGYSYWSIVIASLSIPTVVSLILIFKTRWMPRLIIGRNMDEIYSFGLWSFVRAQIQLLSSKVDYFVIGRYLDVRSLGLYEKSFELTERAMSGLSMPLHGIFFSTFSRVKGDARQVKQIFLEASSLLAVVCYPALFGLIGVAPHFVMSCLGSQWEQSIVPLQVLAAANILRVLLGMIANVNVVTGRYKIHTVFSAIAAIIFALLCFIYVDDGIVAIAFSYLIFWFVSFSLSFLIIYKNIGVNLIDLIKYLWCPLTGCTLMLILVLCLQQFYFSNYNSFLELLYLVASGACFYLAWIYYFYRRGIVVIKIKGL